MKKISVAVLGLVAFVGFANAQMNQKTVVTETVVVSEPFYPVSQVLDMADDSTVIITGKIIKPLGGDMYLFGDSSGTITVEIDDSDWRGIDVTEYDTIKIHGDVERGYRGVVVEADYVEKL